MLFYNRYIKKSLLTLALLFVGISSFAQDNISSSDTNVQGDVLDAAQNVEKKPRFFEHISVGVDLVGPVMYSISRQGDFQAFAQLNVKGKYFPTVEVGYGKADKSYATTDIKYNTKAPFGRIGCDFNLLKDKMDVYKLFAGVRYGISKFDYDTTTPTDSLHTQFETTHESTTLHWAELVFGVDAKIWGPIHMGWSVRYRRRLHLGDVTRDALYVPGFGNASESTSIMGLYTISINI